jgi:ADP-ribose pyrophosphatase YjhB (NUDIX family)
MKIKNVVIKIIKGSKKRGSLCLERALKPAADIYVYEESLRRAVTLGLKRSRNKKTVHFFVAASVTEVFPAVATAKILAQETYRFIKEEKSRLKEIAVVLPDEKLFRVFHKTISGYLTHLLEVLTQGPFVTVDTIIEVKGGIVLIRRSNPPFGWALPGGFVDYKESLEEAAAREAKEETGLTVTGLKQMHTYSRPSRDPRFHTITSVFVCSAKGKPRGASDAAEARIFRLGAWGGVKLAFDHRKVLQDYLRYRR